MAKINESFRYGASLTEALQTSTASFIQDYEECVASLSDEDKEQHRLRWDHVDKLPMTCELAKWCKALLRVNPRLKFARANSGYRDVYTRCNIPAEVWVYLPDQPYALMRLGYKDYRTTRNSSGSSQYGVYSRCITNYKYKSRNEQYCMVIAETFDRALSNAKKYLRAYSTEELMQVNLEQFTEAMSNERMEKYRTNNEKFGSVRNSPDLLGEFRILVNSGYKFHHPKLQAQVMEWLESSQDMQQFDAQVKHAYFVSVSTRFDQQYFDVMEMFNVNKTTRTSTDAKSYREADLPEDIAGSMAALMMVKPGHYISGVGIRTTTTTFYVERV